MSLPMIKARYLARAVGCSFGTAESSNNTQIGVQFEIVDHPDFTGESITYIGHFTDRTTDRTIESLQYLGWKGDDLTELDNLDAGACAHFFPNVVELDCGPDTYRDKTTLKVQWVNQPGGGRFAFKAPVTGPDLKAFAAQMRGTIRGAQQAGPRPAPARPTQAAGVGGQRNGGTQTPLPATRGSGYGAAGGGNDDIPF